MSSSKSVPEPSLNQATTPESASIDYTALVRFLVQPFLDSPDSLKIDCETSPSRPRIWVRLAFEGEDKGRVFGRGGRNIQAIRTVLEASASANSQSIYLDIYGGGVAERDSVSSPSSPSSSPSRTPAPSPPKPQSRPTNFPKRVSG